MKKELVSIIVPVYNVEKYLNECVESLLNQTYSNIEILLIDDGSTDKSGSICDKHDKNNDNIKVIHKKNGGVSSARNLGIEKSTGKYIMFVDSDDFVSYDYVETFVSEMDNKKMVISGYVEHYFTQNINHNITKNKETITNDESLEKIFDKSFFGGYLWNKIFEKKIIIDNGMKFNPEIHMCEDLLFVVQYLRYVESVILIGKCPYMYRMRKSSMVWSGNIKKTISIFDAYYNINKILIKNKKISKSNYYYMLYLDIVTHKKNIDYAALEKKFNYKFNRIFMKVLLDSKIGIKKKIKLLIRKYFNIIYALYMNNKKSKLDYFE